jgi:hypothetical protein
MICDIRLFSFLRLLLLRLQSAAPCFAGLSGKLKPKESSARPDFLREAIQYGRQFLYQSDNSRRACRQCLVVRMVTALL